MSNMSGISVVVCTPTSDCRPLIRHIAEASYSGSTLQRDLELIEKALSKHAKAGLHIRIVEYSNFSSPPLVVGYVLMSRHPFQEVRIHSIAILPEYRRQGVGSRIISSITSLLDSLSGPSRHPWRILADIPESNLVAQLFFRANGFLYTCTVIDPDTGLSCYRLVHNNPPPKSPDGSHAHKASTPSKGT